MTLTRPCNNGSTSPIPDQFLGISVEVVSVSHHMDWGSLGNLLYQIIFRILEQLLFTGTHSNLNAIGRIWLNESLARNLCWTDYRRTKPDIV